MTLLNEAAVLTIALGSLRRAESAAGCNGMPFYALPGDLALSSLYFSFPALLKSLELSVKLTPLEPDVTGRKRTLPHAEVKAAPVSLGESDLASARATRQTL